MDWDAASNRLKKKATFEASLTSVIDWCSSSGSGSDGNAGGAEPSAEDRQRLWELVKRAMTLLKSRYNNPAYWLKGLQLVRAARPLLLGSNDPNGWGPHIDAYEAEAASFLDEASGGAEAAPSATTTAGAAAGAGPSSAAAAAAANGGQGAGLPPQQQQRPQQQPFLFEGQLSAAEPTHDHASARLYRAAQELAERNADNGGGGGGGEGQEDEGAALNRHLGELLAMVFGDVGGGLGDGGLWETDLLPEGFEFEDVRPVARPASKKAVRRLKRVRLTEALLRELQGGAGGAGGAASSGGGADGAGTTNGQTAAAEMAAGGGNGIGGGTGGATTSDAAPPPPRVRCPVCMCEFEAGDEVQVLPCSAKHVFHPPCLAPWLAANNSCPCCRHELPTDDEEYERRKERERAAAEERRGAENAVRGGEFIYM